MQQQIAELGALLLVQKPMTGVAIGHSLIDRNGRPNALTHVGNYLDDCPHDR